MRQLDGAFQLVQAPDQAAHRPAAHGPAAHGIALLLAALLFAALLGACVTRPPDGLPHPEDVPTEPPTSPKPSPYGYRDFGGYPRSAEEVSGAAVINLLSQARSDLAMGRVEQAVASLETALQIEKRNPFVWQQLARAHLQRRQLDDAEIVAQRSNSFARGNPYIEIENWRTIAAARKARGDRAGAEQAREKVTELQDRLED